jgi:hypothetical protein
VKPIYRSTVGATANRDFDSCAKDIHYTDNTARNVISSTQVARDASNLYFHVHTTSPLSPATDKNWMMLFIDADANVSTGWHGYDFLINRSRDGNHCTVERNVGNTWQWRKIADIPIRWVGEDIELAIPRRILGLQPSKGPLIFDFKWADNIPDNPTVMDFYTYGDTAPDTRFNYRFAE